MPDCHDCGTRLTTSARYCDSCRWITRTCLHCGQPFQSKRVTEDKTGKPRTLCSRRCTSESTAARAAQAKAEAATQPPPPPPVGPWRTHAACIGQPPHWWDDEDPHHTRRALTICHTCPVASACLADALRTPTYLDHGIRGGTTRDQRSQHRARRR